MKNYPDFKVRLMFYRGIVTAGNPIGTDEVTLQTLEYPFGTCFDIAPDFSFYGISLMLSGERGLYQNFHKKWLYFNENIRKDLLSTFNFSPTELKYLESSKKYRINNFDVFYKELRYDITNDGISLVEADLVKC